MSLVTAIADAPAGGAVHVGGPNVVHVDGGAIVGTPRLAGRAGLCWPCRRRPRRPGRRANNTWLLEDKTQSVALLVLGLLSSAGSRWPRTFSAGPDAWSPRVPRPGNATTFGT